MASAKRRCNKKLPKGISQRGDTYRWSAMVDGVRKGGSCSTLAEAVAERDHAINLLKNGGPDAVALLDDQLREKTVDKDSRWTLAKLIDLCANTEGQYGWLGSNSYRTSVMNAEFSMKFFGALKDPKDIGEDDIEDYARWLIEKHKNSPATVNRKLSALSKVLKMGKRKRALEQVPAFPSRRREPRGRMCELSLEEEREVLATLRHMGKEEAAVIVENLIDLGCRPSELYWVLSRDVDFETGVILIHGRDAKGTKNGEFRSVPMSARVRENMQKYVEGKGLNDRIHPRDNWWLRHAWEPVRKHMGRQDDPDFTPYICRHTRASRLVKKGVSLQIVKQWLGHKTLEMTMRYAHLMPKDLVAAVSVIDDERDVA